MSQLSLADLLTPERIKIPLDSTDKPGLIDELCGLLGGLAGATAEEVEEIRSAVLQREAVLSTGVGGGVALPHGKSEALDDLVLVAGRTSSPVDFEALDGEPVQLVLLLVGPESAAGLHVKILSRISRILRREAVRAELVVAPDAEAFHRALSRAEQEGS